MDGSSCGEAEGRRGECRERRRSEERKQTLREGINQETARRRHAELRKRPSRSLATDDRSAGGCPMGYLPGPAAAEPSLLWMFLKILE